MAQKRKAGETTSKSNRSDERDSEVRIVGGTFRGRRLQYHGDPVVRPMKHRTRESIFNLVSTECGGRHAIDLFAGTGALGLEALSRGTVSATFIERHVPSARLVEANIRSLGVEDRTTLLVTSAFLWVKRDLNESTASQHDNRPWLVFCSPPYAFFHERQPEMIDLISRIQSHAPVNSIVIVEADIPFDFSILREATAAHGDNWDIRTYAPALVGVWRN